MPFANQHSARLKSPDSFVRIRTSPDEGGPGIDFLFGVREDGGSEIQSIRFDRTKFSVAQARKWLMDHDFSPILFEEATGEESTQEAAHTAPMNADGSCPRGFTKRGGICVRTSTMREAGHEDDGETPAIDEPEVAPAGNGPPTNDRGFSVGEEFEQMEARGRKLTQREANYIAPAPSADKTCGACRFYLRNPDGSELGLCQIVDGAIAWFGTSDAYISASDEAAFTFAQQDNQAEPALESIVEGIRPAFGSPGGKKLLAQTIVRLIPEHKKYVEPFSGAAAVFFAKDPSGSEILNDKDSEIAEAFKFIKANTEADRTKLLSRPMERDRKIYEQVKSSSPKTPLDAFHRFLYLNAFSMGNSRDGYADGVAKTIAHKVGRMDRLAERLKDVEITSRDFREVIAEHDGPDTFFYLDPPYPTQQGALKTDLKTSDLVEAVKKIRGKFILSLPDDKETREAFRGFEIQKVSVRRTMNMANPHVDSELLIANFSLGNKSAEPARIAASLDPVVVELVAEIHHEFLRDLPDGGVAYRDEVERLVAGD